jgi:tRNA1(Val) A37 N6-methylase TrmN6
MVHRTERIMEIIDIAKKYNFEIKRIRFVYPNKSKNSDLVLVECVKNGKPGLKLLPPLFVYKDKGVYSDEVEAMFGE